MCDHKFSQLPNDLTFLYLHPFFPPVYHILFTLALQNLNVLVPFFFSLEKHIALSPCLNYLALETSIFLQFFKLAAFGFKGFADPGSSL